MFPQRYPGYQQQMPYYPNYKPIYHPNMMGYPQPQPPQGAGYFGRPRFGGFPAHPNHLPNQYYQQPQQQSYNPQQMPLQQQYQPQYQYQPQQQQNQSIFHDQNGKIDFKKISGGVQSAIGIVNQVSPMMKTLGGLFTK